MTKDTQVQVAFRGTDKSFVLNHIKLIAYLEDASVENVRNLVLAHYGEDAVLPTPEVFQAPEPMSSLVVPENPKLKRGVHPQPFYRKGRW